MIQRKQPNKAVDSTATRVWIVFTVWAAAGWLTLDEALLEDAYFPDERTDGSRAFVPLTTLVGARLDSIRLTPDLAELLFTQSDSPRALRVQHDSSHLPVHRGSKQPKLLSPTEDLRDAVIVSQRGNLWLNGESQSPQRLTFKGMERTGDVGVSSVLCIQGLNNSGHFCHMRTDKSEDLSEQIALW